MLYDRELKLKITSAIKKIEKDSAARDVARDTGEKHNRRTLSRATRYLDEYRFDARCTYEGIRKDAPEVSNMVPLAKGHFIDRNAKVSFLSVFHEPQKAPTAEQGDDFDLIDRDDKFDSFKPREVVTLVGSLDFPLLPEASDRIFFTKNALNLEFTNCIRNFAKFADSFTAMDHYKIAHGHNGYRRTKISIHKKIPVIDQKTGEIKSGMYNRTYNLSCDPGLSGVLNINELKLKSEVESCNGQNDCYITMNEFSGLRSRENLSNITSTYFDIDKIESRFGCTKEVFAAALLAHFKRNGKRLPTYITDSGNGLHVVFVFEEVIGDRAAAKWSKLWEHIRDFINTMMTDQDVSVPDEQVKDAARFLRIFGSVNSKSGTVCKPMWVNGTKDKPEKVSFRALCDDHMPIAEEEYRKQRLERAEKKMLAKEADLRVLQGKMKQRANLRSKAFNAARYYQIVLEDLLKLNLAGRAGLGVYDLWLFHVTVCLGYVVSAERLVDEVKKMAKLHDWNEAQALSVMSSAIKRAKAAMNQKRENGVAWLSREDDPRYKLSADRLVNAYNLSEQDIIKLDLRAIVTKDIKRERNREYVRNKRMINPEVKDRMKKAVELSRMRAKRNREILEYISAGISIKQIANDFELSRQAIYNVMNNVREAIGHIVCRELGHNGDSSPSGQEYPCQVACHY
ncbi:hypothetical protein [Pseudotabrizicola formosa]|uniref:hypothetical protein n=1 Tax=Pseudotabrizicola formosa TaxID=2030009 RepID=UPI000CD0983E|nr:hypothetical protein [Pseudotabrizicola formosa]